MYPNRDTAQESGGAAAAPAGSEITIDLHALTHAEGATKDEIELNRPPEEKPAAPAAPAAPELVPDASGKKPGDEGYVTTTKAAAAAAPAKSAEEIARENASKGTPILPRSKEFMQEVFNELKTFTGNDEIVMPADTTPENFIERVADVIYKNTEFPEGAETPTNLHPQVKRLQELIDKKIPFEDALKQVNTLSMIKTVPSKDLMKQYLTDTFGKNEQRPNGWDEAKINENIDKMEKSGVLDIEAEKIRTELETHAKAEQDKISTAASTKEATDIAEKNRLLDEKRRTLQKELSAKIMDYTEVLGVPVSKAEMQEYLSDFLYLTTPEEDGIAPGAKLLQSNDNYAKALYMLTRGDTKIKAAITEAKNKTKIDWLKKLDLTPQLSTQVRETDKPVVDLNLLEQPDNFVTKP